MTIVQISFAGAIVAKEAYVTVKSRLNNRSDFIELTVNGGKKLFNKSTVNAVAYEGKKAKRKR